MFQIFYVGDYEFGFDGFCVGEWIDGIIDMGDVVIFKVVQYMGYGIYFVDIGQELVVEIFVFGGVVYKVCDVYKGNVGGDDFFVVSDL